MFHRHLAHQLLRPTSQQRGQLLAILDAASLYPAHGAGMEEVDFCQSLSLH